MYNVIGRIDTIEKAVIVMALNALNDILPGLGLFHIIMLRQLQIVHINPLKILQMSLNKDKN